MAHLHTPLRHIPIVPGEISLAAILRNGQSFRWNATQEPGSPARHWSIGWHDRTLVMHQDETGVFYSSLFHPIQKAAYEEDLALDTTRKIVASYLALDVSLAALYANWQAVDPNFVAKTEAGRFSGIRVLKQDPWETLVCFISSSNNNIGRISMMVRKLCETLGQELPPFQGQRHFAFPTPESLAKTGSDELLRKLGFGYRAPYIHKTALLLLELAEEQNCTPLQYLDSLSKLSYEGAKTALLQFTGVGPKVADCIALFGLGFAHVVPIDTHVWQIAVRDYGFKGKEAKGPVSAAIYEKVQQHLQKIWGQRAGWAQQILFTADLASFADFVDPLSSPTKVKADPLALNPYPTPAPTPLVSIKAQDPEPVTPTRKRARSAVKIELTDVFLSSDSKRVRRSSRVKK